MFFIFRLLIVKDCFNRFRLMLFIFSDDIWNKGGLIIWLFSVSVVNLICFWFIDIFNFCFCLISILELRLSNLLLSLNGMML